MRILFVCLGNICRSPSAEGVFKKLLVERSLSDHYEVDSAGTGDWHIGKSPDPRATSAALAREIDISEMKGRQLSQADYQNFDSIIVMDDQNFEDVMNHCPSPALGKISKLTDYLSATERSATSIADPYYGGPEGFETMLDDIEVAAAGLLDKLEARRQAQAAQ